MSDEHKDDYEEFDNEEERKNFESAFEEFLQRRSRIMEWANYFTAEIEKGNNMILVPEKFTHMKNFPLYLAIRKSSSEESEFEEGMPMLDGTPLILKYFSLIVN